MASVVFSTSYLNEGKIVALHKRVANPRTELAKRDIGHSDGTGFRIGECLYDPECFGKKRMIFLPSSPTRNLEKS